jgi:hypothetical protein
VCRKSCSSKRWNRSGDWQFDDYFEPVGLHVSGADTTVMGLDGSADDGESEAAAAGVGVAGVIDAVERFEELRQSVLRNPRTVVTHGDGGEAIRDGDRDFDAATLS